MSSDHLCDLIDDTIKSVSSENFIKTFKQTLFSLTIDPSREQGEESKKLLKLIAGAPNIDQIPVDDGRILKQKEGATEKYIKRFFNCELCGWAYSNKEKTKTHSEKCAVFWIYKSWKPQKLEDLKFVKE